MATLQVDMVEEHVAPVVGVAESSRRDEEQPATARRAATADPRVRIDIDALLIW